MTISNFIFKTLRRQAQYLEINDHVVVAGRYVGSVTGWQRQPAWYPHEWLVEVWVAPLARHLSVPLMELRMA